MQTPNWQTRFIVFSAVVVLWSAMATSVVASGDPDLPGGTPSLEQIPAGSLVIPMCTNLQALAGTPFNMKAYGLVNELLHANIPVKWAIKTGKSKDAPDFTASAARIFPTAGSVSNVTFYSGPFIVHPDYTNLAMGVISKWGNSVAVYRLASNATVDIRYTIAHKPVIAVLDDGKTQAIQTDILDEAGISTNYYRVLHAADVAFLAASDCYTIVTSPHFDGGVTATNQTRSIREFVMNGGNFLAQCAAVGTYENNSLYGHFHTTKGVTTDNVAKGFSYTNFDMAFCQFQGALDNEGGAIQEWDLNSGSGYTNGAYDLIFNQSNAGNVRAQVSKLIPGKPGSVVFYLGGHSFAGSTLPFYNGRRMYLNALFVPPDRPPGCLINFQTDLCAFLTNTLHCVTNGQVITYALTVTNCGPGHVAGATVTDHFGSSFQNVTWTAVQKGGAVSSALSGSGDINVTVDMPILSTIVYTINATISPTASGPIINTAFVTLPNGVAACDSTHGMSSITNCLLVSAKPPPDVQLSCASLIPAAATNGAQFIAQGGTLPPDQCGVPTTVALVSDASNSGSGCITSPLIVTRTYLVRTGCGDIFVVSHRFTIVDDVAPIISVPSDVTVTCAANVPPADNSQVTASDNCGGVVVSHDADVIDNSICANRYTIARTYHVADSCGNMVSKTQHITVTDQSAPTIASIPLDATFTCASAVPPADDHLVVASDNCGGAPTISHTADVITSSNCVNRFVITRTYVATDACGNSSSMRQTITVNGTIAPSIVTFPPDATYSCASAVPSANDSVVTTMDGCGGNSGTVISHLADSVTASNCVNRFTITRTYVATDACGNSSTRNQTITVNGTTAPTITTFPPDATFSCADGVPAANDASVAATDGCGANVGITISHTTDAMAASNCVNHFTITRTYVATDACGNSSSKSQTITVNGTATPTIATFPADATYSCASAVPTANDSLVTATDGCGANVGLAISHLGDVVTSSNCVNHFTITRTYIATDACGNSSSKTQTIRVSDTTPPTLTAFPADATYNCASAVPLADNALVTANDDCSAVVTVTHDPDVMTLSNCVSRFTIFRTYRVSDPCGNLIKRTQTITVNATVPPTIATFPADATYSCASAVPAANDSLVSATDGCGANAGMKIMHGTDVITSSNCVNHFTISRPYIATDACGNSSSRSQTITVNGTTPPTITSFPVNATFSCAGSVPAPNDSLVVAVDNCGAATATITHEPDSITESNCPNHFTITRTYRVTDACGNFTTRNQIISVNDKTAPGLRSPLPPFEPSYACASEVPPADDTLVHATDNCGGGVFVTHDADVLVSSNCVNRFTLRRVYHVADSCGNTTNFTQTIHVNSTAAPTITAFPLDATYTCSAAVPSGDDSLVTAIDGCGSGQVHISHGADAISDTICDNRYTVHRTYVAVDACGNSASKTQVITINNTTAPTITGFPQDATYSCGANIPSADDHLVVATNACGDRFGMVITHGADVVTSSNCVNRFTIARTYTATDNCGNSATRTQTLTVNGTTPPTIATFPADATYSCASTVPAANDSLVTATDGCGASSAMTITHGNDVITSSNCVNRFTITRTYVATDACGNFSSKNQTITVHAVTPPTITTFPADLTFACAGNVPAADDALVRAADSCGSSPVSVTHDSDVVVSNICVNNFVINRIYRVTDACGNSASRTQTITVRDNIPPTISCPPDFAVSHVDDIPDPNLELVFAADNCSLPSKSFLGESSVTNNNIITFTRTFAATDDCGNSSTCAQTITMNPYLAAPSASPDAYSAFENRTLDVAAPGVLANDSDSNNLSLHPILITGVANGTLTLDADGSFRYKPNPNYVGNDSFTYLANNGGSSSSTVTVSITVIPVNQPPAFNKGSSQIVNNYDPAQTKVSWATGITPGPANEATQNVNFVLTNNNNSIFSVQPAISPNGTMTYAPAAGKYGVATVSAVIKDNGGTANGGRDTSDAQTFSIIVNNPPIPQINLPTNTSLFLYPAPVFISATAYDLDGTVTNLTFLNGTNFIGQGVLSGSNTYTMTWTNAPFSNSVLYAVATDNYGATNTSPPVNIVLGNPVGTTGGPVAFSPSLFTWGQKLSVTNPTISTVESVTVTFTSLQPPGTSVLGATGTNALGQPYIVFNITVPPVTGIANYGSLLYLAPSMPTVTFTTSASLSAGLGFTINSTNFVQITRKQFQGDGSFLLNFLSSTNYYYYVQYSSDLVTWFTSPLAVHGNGTQLQWVDLGPNISVSAPRTAPYRFYRVVAH